jgi:hypothetical protein
VDSALIVPPIMALTWPDEDILPFRCPRPDSRFYAIDGMS